MATAGVWKTDIKGWASGSENAVQTDTITIGKAGAYLIVMAVRIVNGLQTEGTGMVRLNPYRNGSELIFTGNMNRFAIPINKSWDLWQSVSDITTLNAGDKLHLSAYHNLSVATDTTYASAICLKVYRLAS